MPLQLLFLPGDGIGPEIVPATRRVVDAAADQAGVEISVSFADIGFVALDHLGTTLPEAVVEQALTADGVVLGPVSHNAYPSVNEGGINPSGALRRALNLHANIRPARSRSGVPTPTGSPCNMVVVRENLEGFYADRNMHLGPGEFMPTADMAISMRRVTRDASRNIAETAFQLAVREGRRKVTAIHKANVLRVSDGLFLEECRKVAASQPSVDYDEALVDAATALMVRDTTRFDVLVATNMFGDILSDLASELAGGLGLGASLNVGTRHAMAQAQHGSAPDIAGKDIANPTSLIASAAMLLAHLGAIRAARAIEAALDHALADPATRTQDVGGRLGTTAFTDGIIHRLNEGQL
ncbi:MAG: isocitrate/isopropylmalate dehydrogenase family protein [Pseudomonadota bacterium]